MTQEALKLALPLLEDCVNSYRLKYERPAFDKAITAIKEALAQPEQEPVAKYSDIVSDGGLDPRNKFDIPPQRTEQEPVAWTWDTQSQHDGFLDAHFMFSKPESTFRIMNLQALYSHPPRRTWVDLTDEQIDACWNKDLWKEKQPHHIFAKAIEAKLKEKNNG